MYTLIIIKKIIFISKNFSSIKYRKGFFLLNIKLINLWFDELKLITQIRTISIYQYKSQEDLIKSLTEPKPDTKPKPEPEPEPEIRVNKRKLKKLRKDFDELRHKFSKKEIKE